MPLDLPPDTTKLLPPVGEAAIHVAPECRYLTNTEAQLAMARLQRRLPSTSFINARPSEICGLVRVEMESGTVVYTEPTGRYLLLTFALDTHRGSPADVSDELENAIEKRQAFPAEPIPGVLPGIQPTYK